MDIVIIGIGNILFKDEGVGVYAVRYLEENYDFFPTVDMVDGGTLGFGLMSYYQTYKRVLILDTISINDTPGAVYNLPSEALIGLGNYRKTAHEVEVVEMLEICSMLESIAQVSVIGIIPEDIKSVDISLSDSVKNGFGGLIDEAVRELRRCGVKVSKKRDFSLEKIIASYNSPSRSALHSST